MPEKYIPFFPNTVQGQALLNNFVRTRRVLKYRDNEKVITKIKRGMPFYELKKVESVGKNPQNMVIRGECISACAFLKETGIFLDMVYVDPPFASGADYAKKIFLRKNPKIAKVIKKADEKLEFDDLKAFEEKMYGDIWNKESYLNWMFENLMAIKSVMQVHASIFLHMDWSIGHYAKVLLDEVFGEDNFVDEVIWSYGSPSGGRSKGAKFVKNHDTIYHYALNYDARVQNKLYTSYSEKYIQDWFKYKESDGRQYQRRMRGKDENGKIIWEKQYLDESPGIPMSTVWTDILTVYADPRAYTGKHDSELDYEYATQKPEALLKRIIESSSNEKMLVADFFGGSGVTAISAHSLKRNYIHVDVGSNSIQTTRDRLIAGGSEFDILEISDGVNLFRNPMQTMDKLKSTILGLRNEKKLDRFWAGAIQDSKLGIIPVYLPNLIDHSSKVLDIPMVNRIINEAIPELPDTVKKVIVYYIDIDDRTEIDRFLKDQNIIVDMELRDLKQVLDDVVVDDTVEYNIQENKGVFTVDFKKFLSDRLRQKIDEFNQKGQLQILASAETENENGNDDDNGDPLPDIKSKKKKKFKPIEISEEGLELIELVSLDCTNDDGFWISNKEIKIDKLGYVIDDGKKTKSFWDGTITAAKKPHRMKVRNIAGDEIIIDLTKQSTASIGEGKQELHERQAAKVKKLHQRRKGPVRMKKRLK